MDDVEVWDARKMTDAQRRVIASLLCDVWPKLDRTLDSRVETMVAAAAAYDGPDEKAPRSFVIFQGDRLVAHAALVSRTISTAAGDPTIAGLAQVCTDPEKRGSGLGERITRAALGPIDDGSFPLSLFQTSSEVQPFYEKLGAMRVENRFVNSLGDDPEASPWWGDVVMIYPASADWLSGTVDLRGEGW